MLLGGILALALARILLALVPPVTPIETVVWIVLAADLCALLGCAIWQRSGNLVRAALLWGVTIGGVVAGGVRLLVMGMNEPSSLLSTAALVCYGYIAIGALAGRASGGPK